MALAQEDSGTQSATVPTEHELDAWTASNVRVLAVELNNMVAGDIVELRIYMKDGVAGTDRVVWKATYANAQEINFAQSPPIATPFGGKATLNQTAGTSRDFDWHVLTVE
jgi:hypothetical protein